MDGKLGLWGHGLSGRAGLCAGLLLGALVLSALSLSWGRREEAPQASPLPDVGVARQALEASLRVWTQSGRRSTALGTRRVELVDRRCAEGKKPLSYRIQGALRSDWGRGFVVRLDWPEGSEPLTESATYLVAGINPLWVMRRDDIELLMHWEHPMDADSLAAEAVSPGGAEADPAHTHHTEVSP